MTGLLLCVPGFVQAQTCGKERWAVKTLADPEGAKAFASKPIPTTVHYLRNMKPLTRAQLDAAKVRFAYERHRYTVQAVLIGFKHEADDDFHIVIANPTNPNETMIIEIPSAACVPKYAKLFESERSSIETRFGKATAKFKTLKAPVPVTVDGLGFYDFCHGQTGRAPNCAELHPVVSLTFEGGVSDQ